MAWCVGDAVLAWRCCVGSEGDARRRGGAREGVVCEGEGQGSGVRHKRGTAVGSWGMVACRGDGGEGWRHRRWLEERRLKVARAPCRGWRGSECTSSGTLLAGQDEWNGRRITLGAVARDAAEARRGASLEMRAESIVPRRRENVKMCPCEKLPTTKEVMAVSFSIKPRKPSDSRRE